MVCKHQWKEFKHNKDVILLCCKCLMPKDAYLYWETFKNERKKKK